ncbi:MAG: S9 family peptidase [Deltaproteobacteria bacterium]|nr:MAG: S9 family peptidase [Deltaproteobacteria bacterium]
MVPAMSRYIVSSAVTSVLVLTTLGAASLSARAQPPSSEAATRELTLERIFADPPLGGRPPMQLALSGDATVLAYLRPNEADSEVLDLWGRRLPGGAPERLVATADLLTAGGAQKLTEAERMALQRRRVYQRGITSFMWCGEGAEALLFPFSGDLYWARLGGPGEAPEVVRLTRDDDAPELAPKCSPQGHWVSFTKAGDVYVLDVRTRRVKRLTRGAGGTRTFGLAEFIAEEEMGRHEGLWWSEDEQQVLVFEVDEGPVAVKMRSKIFADRTELFEQRYPAAGEANARVTAHVIDVRTGRRVTLKTPTEDGYLARAGFFGDGAAWVQWQSRDQKRLVLYEADAKGQLRTILEDTDDAWVELHDDLRGLPDGKLLWSNEASGRRQLEIVDRASGARVALTAEPDAVDAVVGTDREAGTVFYTVAADRGKERQVRAIALAGGASWAVTRAPGWHRPTFARSGTCFVDVVSSWGRPPQTLLGSADGRETVVLDDNPTPELDGLPAPSLEWRDFRAEDGSVLNGLLMEPVGRRPGWKYPVVAWVYGGPTYQMVANRWTRSYPLLVWLTTHGYGVLLVDNRGTGGRDRAFDRAHYHRVGEVEVRDLFGAVREVAGLDWVDPARIGVWGWSYGGYLAARSVLDADTPFAAAVAVAPVTDWTLYDTHYTERYLGMPEGGKAAPYVDSNLVRRAKLLARPLVVIHGTADDNVLFEHTLRLVQAFEDESAPFEMMIYPGKAHGISGRAAQLHVYKTAFRFFARTLGGAALW